jgi:hypothetical protein
MPAHPVSTEEKQETGLSLEVIGGMVLFFDFLILFFLPAGLKHGQHTGFAGVMIGLAVIGLALIAAGIGIRWKARQL